MWALGLRKNRYEPSPGQMRSVCPRSYPEFILNVFLFIMAILTVFIVSFLCVYSLHFSGLVVSTCQLSG